MSSHTATRVHAEEQSTKEKLERIILLWFSNHCPSIIVMHRKRKCKTIAKSKSDHTWTNCLRYNWAPACNFNVKLTAAACLASMFEMAK